MKRVVTPELLDTDEGTPAEVAGSLADLRVVNTWFGGTATTASLVEQVARTQGRNSLSWLEVGAGAGHVPQVVKTKMAGRGIDLQITLLDRARSHLNGESRAVSGDALALPFSDNSFDIIGCGLFAHHLLPDQLVQFAKESLRVCRLALLINDLIRDPLHLALVYAGFPLYRSRLTRHDAPASVRAAYTISEMRSQLTKAGAASVEIDRHYLFRMGAIAWKQKPTT